MKQKKVIQNIRIDIFRKGQLIFKYKDKCDFAYLILHGQLNFYKFDFRELKYHSLDVKPTNDLSNPLTSGISPKQQEIVVNEEAQTLEQI